MFRGRPPRGGYRPPFEGRGPPPPRPFDAAVYRDDRSRPIRPLYHPGHHDHVPPDPYHRSPPRRRYPSPGSGSHPGGEYWAGGVPRERSPSPRGSGPLDHNLVITVGNELTGPSGPASSRLHERDYPPRPEYERSRSRGRSRPRSHSRERSPDRSRAKSQGRSKSQVRSKSRPRSQSRSPDRSRARSRAKSRGRSRSRSQDRSRAKSRGRSRSRSQDRSRAKSRGRSRSHSPDRSRAKSRGRSKSRHHSRSKSRSRSRSRGRSYSKAASRSHRYRSHSASSSSSSSSHSSGNDDRKPAKEFKELETARRKKELEEMLNQPTKSILKKRNDSEDSPSLRSAEGVEGSRMSHMADQLLQAVKGMEPHMVASMLSELQSDPHMARRAGLDAEIKEILNLLGDQAGGSRAQEPPVDDIDDEEKFLYGDTEEPRSQPSSEPVRHHGLDMYGEVTEEALYGDYPPPVTIGSQMYSIPQPHLSVPPTGGEVDARYTGCPNISPDQNFTVHVSKPSFPPGTEPLEESERQAVEEYEKIQDLLKTIGLDLGVSEISKMAARTKERLHGNKPPPPKTPTRRRYSSGSSDGSRHSRGRRRRSHSSSSSSSSSRSPSRENSKRRGSWSSDDTRKKSSVPPKSHKDKDVKETKAERSDTVPLQQLPQDPKTLSAHPGAPIPTYPPPQVHSMMPPNYPPPGYGQYGNYLPYMHQQWPPMYPAPMTMPPQGSLDEFNPVQPYSFPPPDPGIKGPGKNLVHDVEKGSSKVSSPDARRVSEEQNNESQKLKVLEEREKLKQDREVRMKKKEYLMKELERLRKQQGELLRKKRREKDGHKDPLLQEISRLQEEVMSQISNLRKEHEAAEKKRSEIDKIALILGLNPSDRPNRTSKQAEDKQPQQSPPEKKKRVCERSPEERPAASSSSIKTSVAPPSRQSCEKLTVSAPPVPTPAPAPAPAPLAPPPEPFEYYDAGNHWCKNCNVTSGSMFDFFTHLHSKLHRKTLDPYERPWASIPTKISKTTPSEEKLTKPAKGSEFLLPVRGFFCLLCKDFFGDAICAEEHVTTHNHNDKYKKQMYENPMYEQRRNLDRQAGLASDTSGKKRKHEDNEKGGKDKEEKSKHKKEKKEKKRGGDDEDKVKVKEEQGEKLKQSKKEDDSTDEKSHDEGRLIHNKKDGRKDDKYHYNREGEDTGKYRRDEEERYKYSREEESRYRYRRDEDDRYEERSKYGSRDEDRYKCSKYPDSKSKFDKEREDGKPNSERQAFKKPEQERPAAKPEPSKPEPPPKPYDMHKVFCGPSPAMRAKLRKQSQEAGKPAPVAATTSFGRFTWKKKENVLAKEAQKAAAEFIKDDEEAQKSASTQDSFAKSMAVAKEIAQKLGGTQNMPPPPWVPNQNNRGRGRGRGIRPNLPAPAAVARKTAMMGKPAPLNTFLSIRPQNTSILGPPPKDLPTLQQVAEACRFPVPFQGPPKVFGARPKAAESKPPSTSSDPRPLNAKTDPLVSGSAPSKDKSAPLGSIPAKSEVNPQPLNPKPVPPVLKSAETDTLHVPSDPKPLPLKTTPAPSCVTTLTPPVGKPPQPAMIKIVSDVAAPGVPESEQTRTVFVKPPPFMRMGEAAQKSEKHKSNLAAAKAKDLFDIFYSGTGQSGTSSITKTTTDTRADQSGADKSGLPAPQNTQPQQELVTQYQPPAVVSTTLQPGSNKASSVPETQPGTGKGPLSPKTQPETDKKPPGPKIQQEVDKNPPGPTTKPETDKNPPCPKTQTETEKGPASPKTQLETDKTPPGPKSQPETDNGPPSSKTQPETAKSPPGPKTEIQISSVWSMQTTPAEGAPFKGTLLTKQPILNLPDISKTQGVPQNKSSTSKSTSQTNTELEPGTQNQSQTKQASLDQTDPQSEPNQDTEPESHLEPHLDTAPVSDSKPGRKTRGKATPTKKSCPAPRPVRQTRSQTRYQTRNQQQQQSQSETEPDLASGDSDSAASDSKGLDTSDPGSGLLSMEEATNEEDPQMMEITPETLGLPSDMASLDFEYDFNFE